MWEGREAVYVAYTSSLPETSIIRYNSKNLWGMSAKSENLNDELLAELLR